MNLNLMLRANLFDSISVNGGVVIHFRLFSPLGMRIRAKHPYRPADVIKAILSNYRKMRMVVKY
jgi:hypothetical protein